MGLPPSVGFFHAIWSDPLPAFTSVGIVGVAGTPLVGVAVTGGDSVDVPIYVVPSATK